MLAYTRRRRTGFGDAQSQTTLQQAYQAMASAAPSYPDIVAHGGMALAATSNAATRAAERAAAGVDPAEGQMEEAATGESYNGTGWAELYNSTPAASAYPLRNVGSVFNTKRYTLDGWWASTYAPPAYSGSGVSQNLAPSLVWAAGQSSTPQNWPSAVVQQAVATKPGQSVPPTPQSGEVPATTGGGGSASLAVDTSSTTTSASSTGFDLSSLFTTTNMLIGGAVLVGLFVVMGMGKGKR